MEWCGTVAVALPSSVLSKSNVSPYVIRPYLQDEVTEPRGCPRTGGTGPLAHETQVVHHVLQETHLPTAGGFGSGLAVG